MSMHMKNNLYVYTSEVDYDGVKIMTRYITTTEWNICVYEKEGKLYDMLGNEVLMYKVTDPEYESYT